MSNRARQSIPPIHDQNLLEFIQQSLSDEEKIPIGQELYDRLVSDPCNANDGQALFRIGGPLSQGRIEPIIHASFNPGATGKVCSYILTWDTNIRTIIEVLERSGTSNRDSSRRLGAQGFEISVRITLLF